MSLNRLDGVIRPAPGLPGGGRSVLRQTGSRLRLRTFHHSAPQTAYAAASLALGIPLEQLSRTLESSAAQISSHREATQLSALATLARTSGDASHRLELSSLTCPRSACSSKYSASKGICRCGQLNEIRA